MKLNTIFVYTFALEMPLGYFGCDAAGRVATSRNSQFAFAFSVRNYTWRNPGDFRRKSICHNAEYVSSADCRSRTTSSAYKCVAWVLQSPATMAAATAAMTMESMAALCCIGAALSQWHFISVGLSATNMMLCQNIVHICIHTRLHVYTYVFLLCRFDDCQGLLIKEYALNIRNAISGLCHCISEGMFDRLGFRIINWTYP